MFPKRCKTGMHLVDQQREMWIERVSSVPPILDSLLSQNLLSNEQYDEILAEKTPAAQMRMVYKFSRAWGNAEKDIFLEILRKKQPHLSFLHTSDHLSEGEVKNKIQTDYKENTVNKYEKTRDYNSLQGERVDLRDRYIRLQMINKHHEEKEKELQLKSRGEEYIEQMTKHADEATCIEVQDLFAPHKEDEREPATVVLHGPAGIGKTFTVNKIMMDWASNNLFCDRFDYVFHLNCRDLNTCTNDVSLVDLILNSAEELQPAIEEILAHPEKLLFIIDGFDELKFSLNQVNVVIAGDWNTRHSVEITLCRLLKKKILSKSKLLITTRATALENLGRVVDVERCVEILGFSEGEIKEYVSKFYKDEQQASVVFNYIAENEAVFSMCFVPVVCWIVCSVMKDHLSHDESLAKKLKTTTQIFAHFVNKLLKHHGASEDSQILHQVGLLAFRGVYKKQVLFEKQDLVELSLDPAQCTTFFSKVIFKQELDLKSMYHFLHLSIQELFAAFFCATSKDDKFVENILNESMTAERDHLIHVIRFLFGLSNVKTLKIIQDNFTEPSSVLRTQLEKWIPQALCFYKDIELLNCFYETQDEEFVKCAMKNINTINVSQCHLSKSACLAIRYCIEQSDQVDRLDAFGCQLGKEEVKILLGVLPKCQSIILSTEAQTTNTALEMCEILSAHCFSHYFNLWLEDSSGRMIFFFQISKKNRFSSLYVTGSDSFNICIKIIPKFKFNLIAFLDFRLGEESTKHLIEMVKCSMYKLEYLSFSAERLTLRTMESAISLLLGIKGRDLQLDISRALDGFTLISGNKGAPHILSCMMDNENEEKDNKNVEAENKTKGVLDRDTNPRLTLTGLNDESMKQICDTMKKEHSVLHTLSLSANGLTEACVPDICMILAMQTSLKHLELGNNHFGDTVVKQLCTAFNGRQLEALNLSANGLTEACVPDICMILAMQTSLKHLELGNNHLGDSGVKQLCTAFNGQQLEALNLSANNLTEACAPDICMILAMQTSLKHLELGNNHLGDTVVKQLCTALNGRQLESLSLADNNLTDSCVMDLCKMLNSMESLRLVNLENNSFTGESAPSFIKSRRDYHCDRMVVKLSGNQISKQQY
ncbi:NACHT, LRR and PYD domains-containing protein 3-like isoform X3 [Polyodon spathula]|uniref:NACHT, LRR and PYD domains-containing protein 3-like isoform X3 n=1 Tax=Polyodon spathula TaxID=7913 RepID=UPI001B7E34C5|nr:NACHT, LRR and PYD domains-containing protein 3-like isoform X3 [Polyodon spathula]